MSPAPLFPFPNMDAPPQRTASTDSTSDGIRKRVCKACDRCRLKKSKCDGSHPCSRCKADNAICVFGERKKSHDKVYPKGYVEMLEQQQGQLVSGLQEMYQRLLAGQQWPGQALSESNGHPLTHDILAALDLLETRHDGSGELETFEEDCEKLQSRLLADGAGYVRRRGSFSSESEHSQHIPSRSSSHSTPAIAKAAMFDKNFTFSASPSPAAQSPVPRQRQSYPPAHQSPLHRNTPLMNDSPLYQSEWSMPTFSEPESILRSKFAMQTPHIYDQDDVMDMMGNYRWDDPHASWDHSLGFSSYPQQISNAFGGLHATSDFASNGVDPMDLLQVAS